MYNIEGFGKSLKLFKHIHVHRLQYSMNPVSTNSLKTLAEKLQIGHVGVQENTTMIPPLLTTLLESATKTIQT